MTMEASSRVQFLCCGNYEEILIKGYIWINTQIDISLSQETTNHECFQKCWGQTSNGSVLMSVGAATEVANGT